MFPIIPFLHKIGTLLLYGIADTTDSAMPEGSAGCAREDVVNIRDTLREGHQRVEDIQVECVLESNTFKTQIYALLSDGGEDAPEHKRMPSLLWYNRNCVKIYDEKTHGVIFFFSQRYNRICAQTPDEKIDGVAVNNENYPKGSAEEKIAFLTNLSKIGPSSKQTLQAKLLVM